MNGHEKRRRFAAARRSAQDHLDQYRSARRAVALRAARGMIILSDDPDAKAVGFHAIGLAELWTFSEGCRRDLRRLPGPRRGAYFRDLRGLPPLSRLPAVRRSPRALLRHGPPAQECRAPAPTARPASRPRRRARSRRSGRGGGAPAMSAPSLPCLDCGHELVEHPGSRGCAHHFASTVPVLECDCHHDWFQHANRGAGPCQSAGCSCVSGRFTVTGYGAGRLHVCQCPRFLGERRGTK
jgi:hypothetical protein